MIKNKKNSNNNNEKNALKKKKKKKKRIYKYLLFFPSFLPIMKTRTVNIQVQKFNKHSHSYTIDSHGHDFIC